LASKLIFSSAANYINTVVVDSAGKVITGGGSFSGPDGIGAVIFTFPAGGFGYSESYAVGNGGVATIMYMVQDSTYTYLTGKYQAGGDDFDWFTAKFNTATGNQVWMNLVNGTGNAADIPCGIAVDSIGQVYVAGTVDKGSAQGSSMAAVKYDSTGAVVWKNLAVTTTPGATGNCMCLANNDLVFVGGMGGQNLNFAVVPIDTGGNPMTAYTVGGTKLGVAASMTADANSNIAVAGYIYPSNTLATNAEFMYIKSNQTLGWTKNLSLAGLNAKGAGVQFDATGNVYVCSNEANATNTTQIDTIKFDTAGTLKWQSTFKGLNISSAIVYPGGMVIDKYGDTYLSGASYFSSSYTKAAYLVKYNTAGTQMFVLYHGIAGSDEVPTTMTINADSDIFVGGYARSPATSYVSLLLQWTQAPIANNDVYTAAHNNVLTVNGVGVLANDTFTKAATVTVHTAPTHGTLVLNANGSFKYTPTNGYVGPDSFQYTASKATGGGISNVATVTITVS
jgi:hypothetical protein